LEPDRTDIAAGGPSQGVRIGRRGFLRYLLGFGVFSTLAMVATPVLGFLVPPKSSSTEAGGRVPAGTTADIPVGAGKVVAMGSTPVIVTNTAQGVHAFSAVCTHLGCIVAFDTALGQIGCPCHGGVFNASTGAVVSGPPPAPLKPVSVVVEKDQIFLVNG
jgi:Rieske Fe-S protein